MAFIRVSTRFLIVDANLRELVLAVDFLKAINCLAAKYFGNVVIRNRFLFPQARSGGMRNDLIQSRDELFFVQFL